MSFTDRCAENIVILGSTGSIGTQTLDIIREYPDRFKAVGLVARKNWELLARQAREFMPAVVAIADTTLLPLLKDALSDLPIEVWGGDDAIADVAAMPGADTVVTAMVGYSGLQPTIRAIEAGRRIALANKETLVVAGSLITDLISRSDSHIVPVDSEHSAIFQCLVGENRSSMRKIILTASGGPFRTLTVEELQNVTVADALHHPNWKMGAKVTIDSASMMNKGFEMIEACWLFGCRPEDIEIVVHPQSVVHSMVEFHDGSIKAQLGIPDMRLPIRYALGYPERLATNSKGLSVSDYAQLTFESPDMNKFPLLRMAFEAIEEGGTMPCILNAANEIAVSSLLDGSIRFVDMPRVVEKTMQSMTADHDVTLPLLVETNREARKIAEEIVRSIKTLTD